MATSEQLSLGFATGPMRDTIESGDMPEGWRLASLGTACEINPSRKGRTNYDDAMPVTFVAMAAVDEVRGIIAAPETRSFSAVKKGYTWFTENDVLFAKITPCMQNGKAAIARNLTNGVGFGSTEFHVLRPGPDVLPEWIHLFIRQPSFRAAAAQHFTGSVGQQRVPESFLTTQLLPVPPLAEQRRIVARIEELAARIERARGLRREALAEVEIAARRAAEDTIDHLVDAEQELGALLLEDSRNGLSQRPSDEPPGMPILRISAATSRTDAIVDEGDYRFLPTPSGQDVSAYILQSGDLLACRFNGNLRFVGRFSLYQGYLDEPRVYPDKLIRFRLDTETLLPRFGALAMNSPKRRTLIEARCSTTAGNIGISGSSLRTVSIPVPPLSVQQEVVEFIDGIQSQANALKQLQAESAAELDALLPAVLERAFKGEM